MDALDLSKVCRLCLKGGNLLCPIFLAHNGGPPFPPLPARILACAAIRLSPGDGLPENICTSCLAQVDRSYQFKVLCESSDLALRGAKAGSEDEVESMDGSEAWDMTKFTPEVIIKEDNDFGEDNNLNRKLIMDEDDDKHRSQPPPPLYPLPGLISAPTPLPDSESSSSKSRRCRGGDKLFQCRQCNKSYSFSSALSRHKAVHNTALRPHVCTVCNKGFTQLDKLARHQKTHSIEFIMSCDVCQRPFKSFGAYQKHRASGCTAAPTAESPAAPPADSQTDGTMARPIGKGKPEFACKVCSKLFATRGSLEVHSTIHTGVRPFVCSVCDKSFRHKVNLMEHFQRKHSLVRPYICDVCAARFVTKQELVRHYRKHIGD